MEAKLQKLYTECLQELNSIGIDFANNNDIGKIDISIAKRTTKRYGCCKQENPDKNFKIVEKIGNRKKVEYAKFQEHHIEISKWVMELEDKIIKNTILHEMIHCIPFCNNHGEQFKKYATYINTKLGYNIKRVGSPKEDYEKSNIPYVEKEVECKYKIKCQKCSQEIYRQRFNIRKLNRYRCGKCGGKLEIIQ